VLAPAQKKIHQQLAASIIMKNIRKSSALKFSRIFQSEVKKQIEINRLIKVANVSALQLQPLGANARSNKNIINYFNVLKYYLKGLQIYSNFLNTYVSSWNNKSLISAKQATYKNTLEGDLSNISATEATSSANASIQSANVNSTSTRILSSAKVINKYLKSITKFNFVPAIGSSTTRARRLNLFNYSQQINYNFNSLNNILIKKICNLLFNSFFSMNCIISKPIFEFKNDKIVIHLFVYLAAKKELLTLETRKNKSGFDTLLSLNKNKISILCTILSQLFNKEVVLELNRIYYPYFDSNIFVNLLAQIINKIKLRRITKRFFLKAKMKNPFKQLNTRGDSGQALGANANLPSLLSGLHIKISGRLLTNRIIPKKTTNIISRGALAKMKVNYLDIARYTNKNKRGAFTITITSGQNLT